MNRRTFIQQTGIAAGGIMLMPSLISAAGKPVKLTVLHTNDTHSNIDPFPANHGKYPGQGGVSSRAATVECIRSEEDNVLLLDAGDIFQGTPYFNKFHGVLEMKALSAMKYDVATLGNHDFDIGMQGFLDAAEHADFPFVNANYDLSKTVLSERVKPYTILKRSGIKIGVFGVGINLEGLVPAQNTAGMVYNDPIPVAQKVANQLREEEKCDLVICLSHIGYSYDTDQVSDRVLASETDNIDLIIGGHTHTFLEHPEMLKNKSGGDVLVNQVGYAGLFLGRIDLEFSKKGLAVLNQTSIALHAGEEVLDKA